MFLSLIFFFRFFIDLLNTTENATENEKILNYNLKIVNRKLDIQHALILQSVVQDKQSRAIIKKLMVKKTFHITSENEFQNLESELSNDPIVIKQLKEQLQKTNAKTAGTLISLIMDSVFSEDFKCSISWLKIKKSEVVNLIVEAVICKFQKETESGVAQKISQHIRTAKLKYVNVDKHTEA